MEWRAMSQVLEDFFFIELWENESELFVQY